MRVLKKLNAALALTLTLALVAPIQTPVTPVAVAEAATVKINKTKKTLKVGQTYQLKITGTKKTVKWKSSKKSVASVSSKGKVTAKKVGKTNITATVGGKTLKCKITVKASENPALANAPFDAKEVTTNGFSFVVPKNWVETPITDYDEYVYYSEFKPSEEHLSTIGIALQKLPGASEMGYPFMKGLLSAQFSEENMAAAAAESFENATLSAYEVCDVETNLGTAFKLSYEISTNIEDVAISVKVSIYALCIGDYIYMLEAMEVPLENVTSPTPLEAAEYAIYSFIKK